MGLIEDYKSYMMNNNRISPRTPLSGAQPSMYSGSPIQAKMNQYQTGVAPVQAAAAPFQYQAGVSDERGTIANDYYNKYADTFKNMSDEQLAKYANWHYDPFVYDEQNQNAGTWTKGTDGQFKYVDRAPAMQADNDLWTALDPSLAMNGGDEQRWDYATQGYGGIEKAAKDRQILANIAAYENATRGLPEWQKDFYNKTGGYGAWVNPYRGNQTGQTSFADLGGGNYRALWGDIPGNTPEEKLNYVENNPETDLWTYDVSVDPTGKTSNITGSQYYEGQDVGGEGWETITNIVGGLLSLVPGGQLIGPAIIAGGQLGSAANREKDWTSALLGAGTALAGPIASGLGINTSMFGNGGMFGSTGSSMADSALNSALSGAGKSAIKGGITGNFDPAKIGTSAITGGLGGAFGDVYGDLLPSGLGGIANAATNYGIGLIGKDIYEGLGGGGSSGGGQAPSGGGYAGAGSPMPGMSGGFYGPSGSIPQIGASQMPQTMAGNFGSPMMAAAIPRATNPALDQYRLGWEGYGDFNKFNSDETLESLKDYLA